MYKKKKTNTIISIAAVFLMIATSFSAVIGTSSTERASYPQDQKNMGIIGTFDVYSTLSTDVPSAITVSDSNPFYSLIATPLAVHYDEQGNQKVIPLYVKNLDNPSRSVVRAEQQIGIYSDYIINDLFTPKEISLYIAEMFWDETSTALVIKNDTTGYNLGVVATPLASYLDIPVIVTDEIDENVKEVLDGLNVENLYICGDLNSSTYFIKEFHNVGEIINESINVISDKFGETVNYITIANPLDVTRPSVLDTQVYDFTGTVSSMMFLPTQTPGIITKGVMASHEFNIPKDYKYVLIKLDLKNLKPKNAESLGDKVSVTLVSPEGPRYFFASTCGGIPTRDDDGNILEDKLHYEIALYDKPGTYNLQIYGQWATLKDGPYEAKITVEKINNPIIPLMDNLSSVAPYIAAYHKGIVFAKPEFAFAADDNVIYNGTTCPGVTQPGTNPNLVVPSNEHTMQIHSELNDLLAKIAGIPVENLEELRDHYAENPAYVAIVGDPTMVPMYFYYNPDGRLDAHAYMFGFALPSDFMYGDIDPIPDDLENDTYSYWPSMENAVGRITGWDVQDCSALIARTIFYDDIISKMGEWKDNALVQTGCGLEFQNLPFITKLSQIIYHGRGEPTKFPTGEGEFTNMRLKSKMELGYDNVKNTFHLQSQREGFTRGELKEIKQAGILNRLLFPAKFIEFLDSKEKITGGQDQLNSSLIFTFAHGSYNLYEHGDVVMDSRGFPFVTAISRIYPGIRSGLSSKGSYTIRSVENMNYGPCVIFVESCITGRTDGMSGKNVLSQAYIHAGANAYIGATRVTADPGYLEPRPLPGGWGFGILGLINATLHYKLKGEYPDVHFGAVIGENLILSLIEDNAPTGLALRNAKNVYLEKDANSTFLWTPPLTLSTGCSVIDQEFLSLIQGHKIAGNERTRVLDKKYVALHEFQLYGDPAFNPYQSVNNG